MPREMHFHAFRQQAFAAALTTTRESGAPAFGAHARTKSVLAFPGAFGALQCAFHMRCRRLGAEERLH